MPSSEPNFQTLESALSDAWERKKPLLQSAEAIRLLNASASGIPRLVLELYGKHALFFDYGSGLEAELRASAERWMKTFGWGSVSVVDRTLAGDAGRAETVVLAGEVPERASVREGPLTFLVEPRHPRNVGLFLDTRELRREIRARAAGAGPETGARVLNLFAYTGSLGLAALAGGAGAVTQVDISARYLDWGRENLRLSGLREDACKFTRMDSERYLDWAARKGLEFDLVVLDPPVFSRFEGKVFRFGDDYFRLAEKCLARLAPKGALYAVTNYSGVSPLEFSGGLREAARRAGKAAGPPARLPLPSDYDLPPDALALPEGNALIYRVDAE
jgi:23S rRNA (cytosine1962-C5)-methyltransferase